MPDPISVMVLGRLAIDLTQQGKGIGPALLCDAISARCKPLRLLVNVCCWFMPYGYMRSPIDPMTLMITLSDAHRDIAGS